MKRSPIRPLILALSLLALPLLPLLVGAPSAEAEDLKLAYVITGYPGDNDTVQAAWDSCKDMESRHGAHCDVFSGKGQQEQIIRQIETAMTLGAKAMVIQASDPATLGPVLQRAHDDGIPVALWTNGPLAGLDGLNAPLKIGVDPAEMAQKLTGAAASIMGDGKGYCTLSSDPILTQTMTGILMNKFGDDLCKMSVPPSGPSDDLTKTVVTSHDLKVVIIPYWRFPDSFDALKQFATSNNKETGFVSGAGSYRNAMDFGANALLDFLDKQTPIPPEYKNPVIIQISTGDYCDTCDCNSSSQPSCKDCKKCKK